MRPLYERLLKVLKLEESKGFTDTAVIGGLEGFLNFWLADARRVANTPTESAQVDDIASRLNGYAQLDAAQRAQRVYYLYERLQRTPAPRAGADVNPPAARNEADQSQPAQTTTPTPRRAQPARPAQGQGQPPQHRQGREPRRDGETIAADGGEHRPRRPAADATPRRPDQDRQRREADFSAAEAPQRPVPTPLPKQQRRVWTPEEALRLDRDLDRPLTVVPGIGAAKADRYTRLGLQTVRDLLYHVPHRYEDYTALKRICDLMLGDEVTIAGVIQEVALFRTARGTVTVTAKVSDGTGVMQVRWFGNKYIVNQLSEGAMVRLSGKVNAYLGRLLLASPRWEVIDTETMKSGRLIPVYPLTEGVTEKGLSGDIGRALELTAGKIPDSLPLAMREQHDLVELAQAVRWLHQPQTLEQAAAARKRLAFDELLRLQLGMLQQRAAWRGQPGFSITPAGDVVSNFLATLPFALTGGQRQSLDEILADMAQPASMSRLLQGDVGSGKTVVAAAALLSAVSDGYQGALMVPTEILAEQHTISLHRLLNPADTALVGRPIRVALLVGSLPAKEKEAIRQAIVAGEIDVVVGTHALIQQDVTFAKLGLAIVDEQHRFGVQQRGLLRSTSTSAIPDLLVMSATPIPRSLALTLYGDLDLSVISELPPGRQPIVTRTITPPQRERAYTYIRRQLAEGRQAFIICPLVEESDKSEAKAAVEEYRFLQNEVFPEFKVELLHGRLRPDEKEAAMARFYRNESQLLVSTSVVEVGIDVPNASVMLIEGANRFGLAQLHQFRGRIGRGPYRSLCLLMAEESISADGETRLQVLVENSDGFALAEQDLNMRGPGDFFGTRQSGLPALKMAPMGDSISLHAARESARDILAQDPTLAEPAHQLLRQHKEHYWSAKSGTLS